MSGKAGRLIITEMTELEFEILDELYFVQPFTYLQSTLPFDDNQLFEGLKSLVGHGWIRCYHNMTDEIDKENLDLEHKFKEYCYLASKTGLMAHNST